jgi:tellurite resistance protein
VALGVVAFVLLTLLYFFRIVFHAEEVKKEFMHPATLGFCGAWPVGISLVAGGLTPYLPGVANVLWWAAVAIFGAFFAWGIYRVAAARFGVADIYPGWLIVFVGGIVYPSSGIGLGNGDASRFIFAISAAVAVVLYAALVYRVFAAPPLPPRLRPSWFILLVPPSLIGAHGFGLFGIEAFEYGFFAALAVLAALLVYALRLFRWEFNPVWWSMTFPLDAFAYAAARYAQNHPEPVWKGLAGFALLLATLVVSFVLLKSLFSLAATRRSAASPAA